MIVGGGGEHELPDLKRNNNFSVIGFSHFKTCCYFSVLFIVLFKFRFPKPFLFFLFFFLPKVLAIGRRVELSPASARHWWSSPALFHAADKNNMQLLFYGAICLCLQFSLYLFEPSGVHKHALVSCFEYAVYNKTITTRNWAILILLQKHFEE